MKQGNRAKVIFLNGASSSGKTTIAKELQNILAEPYLHIGIDTFINMLPSRYIGFADSAKEGFYWERSLGSANDSGRICAGGYGKRVVSGMGYACLALLRKGLNIIMDEVCYGKPQLDFYRNLFKDFPVIYVGVHCPLDVILDREQEYMFARLSTAAEELEVVHEGITYDLEVDTSVMTSQECAEEIDSWIRGEFKHMAK